ncbi:sugar transferase [Lacticaseibacillus pantheris]|uniref:sugar transferase n=1 Tax=Lacticaseibacillus pantheris TaxID=171523 RepID=UPI00265A9C88|nr:sugar transferase [Lacticaseibacillus pantheris]WKF84761.1 sugar transferase [Lacticaseibacillus pantheris]
MKASSRTTGVELMRASTVIYRVIKRLMDIIGSCIALVLFSPIILYIVIAIKIEDRGPVLYKQTRVGKDGQEFDLWKFRSMVQGADKIKGDLADQNEIEDGPMFKIKDDPRITKTGRFIRHHSLDEVPQFVNILKGDMSLVGPRPALPKEVAEYSERDMERLQVIPGLTGLWQVSGRSKLTFAQMVDLDLQYIGRRSTWFDMKIIFKTFLQMFDPKDSGAY